MKTKPSTLNDTADTAKTTTTTTSESKRDTSFDVSTTTSPEPYVYSQLSISEYRILIPKPPRSPL